MSHKLCRRLSLSPSFGGPSRREERERIVHDALKDADAVRAAIERGARLVCQESGAVAGEAAGRNVRRIAHDDVDRSFETIGRISGLPRQ